MSDADLVEMGLNVFAVGFAIGFAAMVMLTMLFVTLAVIRKLAGVS